MYAEVRESTPGKLVTPHERGPNETKPRSTYRPVWGSSLMNGPPLSPNNYQNAWIIINSIEGCTSLLRYGFWLVAIALKSFGQSIPWHVSRSAVPWAHIWLSLIMIGVREFALNRAYDSAHDFVSTMGNCKYCGNELAPESIKFSQRTERKEFITNMEFFSALKTRRIQ